MMQHILRCPACGAFTMKQACPACSTKAITTRPAKFSLEDKYGRFRREAKRLQEDA